jgi:2,3-diketo-5-methylthio-1-phosphopentane phosphatase
MGSVSPNIVDLPALASNPKFIFFTDFDGTITLQDSNDFLTDNLGFGRAERVRGNKDVLYGKKAFRDSFTEMLESIKTPFPECIDVLLNNISMDPHFADFYAWAQSANVPVVVISGGMKPIIEALLTKWLGEEGIKGLQIVSNGVEARPGMSMDQERGWQIVFHDERYPIPPRKQPSTLQLTRHSSFGHDKSLELRKYSSLPAEHRPILFYAGDGVSDLSAARETDLMFAKAGKGNLYPKKSAIYYSSNES